MDKTIYSKDSIEFVTVATEFCAYLERAETLERKEFTGRLSGSL